jgi:uncharacterized protein YlxP (DUF503 family)
MIVGTLLIQINLHAIASLKDKRRIVKSVIERLRSRFHCSAAEIDAQDSKLVARVGVARVSNNGNVLNRQLDLIADFIRQDGRFFVGRMERELFPVDDGYSLESGR